MVGTCLDIGRHDLRECAELGVSELVTNALLHACPPLSVRVRGTWDHPRVEVHDGSREMPELPSPHAQEEDLLLTFGRGLSIVARCSSAWGVEVEDDGKTVWFAPAPHWNDEMVDGVVTGTNAAAPAEPAYDEIRVDLRGVPVPLFAEFQRHYRELRREVRLLALAHEEEYPLAKELSDLYTLLERELRDGIGSDQVERALRSGAPTADLHLSMRHHAAETMERFIELLELADSFCRQERLLSLARTPQQREFQRWFLGEFARQGRGAAPEAWSGSVIDDRRATAS